ncbi:MAG TPA: hypothetical protein VK190_03425 [Pseudoneobacillus sp.]|nr:hypothetical protein [Pseudoneobacillus sp.]
MINTHMFTEEGLKMLLNATSDEQTKKEINIGLEAFQAADMIADETEHEWVNREGKLGDLLAEMETFLKDQERELVFNSIRNVLGRLGWIFKGTYILGESAVVGTGKGVAKLFKHVKKNSAGAQATNLEALKLQIRLKELEIEEQKLRNKINEEEVL